MRASSEETFRKAVETAVGSAKALEFSTFLPFRLSKKQSDVLESEGLATFEKIPFTAG